MRFLKKTDFRSIFQQLKSEGLSMRRRFALYIICTIILVLSLALLLLNLFGILNPAHAQIADAMEERLIAYSDDVRHDYDRLAAYALSFRSQIEENLRDYLTEKSRTFRDLRDDSEALGELQGQLYSSVYLHMQLAPCSGAFYLLDTTVNSHSQESLYNGIYLKYIDIYSDSTVNNEFSLFRGAFSTGRAHQVRFHSGWQNEIKTDFFSHCQDTFPEGIHYALSPVVSVPNTWERARYLYVPIRDPKGEIIGTCGFEVNDLFFQLSRKTAEDDLGQLVFALLDQSEGRYTGQFSSNPYNAASKNCLEIQETGDIAEFSFGSQLCMGPMKEIPLGNRSFTAALMLSTPEYESYLQKGKLKLALISLIITIFSLGICLFMSRKYVSPLLRKLEQLRSREQSTDSLRIPEIEDLFVFLAARDEAYEEQLRTLQEAKAAAEAEALRSKEEFERAKAAYDLAQQELQQLYGEKQKEIVPEEYEYFASNLQQLTPTEKRIYELYLDGKKAADIQLIMNITVNTLKYHNKNIYSKLGINSRKQLLRFATLKQHMEKA